LVGSGPKWLPVLARYNELEARANDLIEKSIRRLGEGQHLVLSLNDNLARSEIAVERQRYLK
jgi:hypothetical protein